MPAFADRYVVLERVGAGAMGTIHRARDLATGEEVALKRLRNAMDPRLERRLVEEASVLSSLRHPAIVRYRGHGTFAGESFLVMEWLAGETLASRLRRGCLSVEETVGLAVHVAGALETIHERGIIHRDIKPSNLMLCDDTVKLLDFGIARRPGGERITQVGAWVGTPRYGAPEQLLGSAGVTPAADVYALGCVMFECLAGRALADDDVTGTTREGKRTSPLLEGLRHLPAALRSLLARMLAHAPAGRPADGAALAAMLERVPRRTRWLSQAERRVVSVLACVCEPGMGLPQSHRVRVIRRQGATVVFAPIDRGVAADQAATVARLALALRARFPEAAMALATGFDAAERAAPPATAGSIEVDEATASLLEPAFDLDGRLLVGRRDAWRPRSVLGAPTPFVGRARELALLETAQAQSIEDSALQIVLVTGAPGTGKSRLGHELVARLRARPQPPCIIQAPHAIDGETADRALAELATRPVVLILDDLQWAGAPGLVLIDEILAGARDRPLFVLGLGRPEVHERVWSERAMHALRLSPLRRDIAPSADGNPLLHEELLVAAARGKELTDAAVALIHARIDGVGREGRRILRAASFFEGGFTPEAVRALVGPYIDVEGWLGVLAQRDLIVADGATWAFRSALVRAAVKAQLTAEDRARGRAVTRTQQVKRGALQEATLEATRSCHGRRHERCTARQP